MKKLALALTIVGLLAIPAGAQAAPYLSSGEACRHAGWVIYKEYTNIRHGSGTCQALHVAGRRDMREVTIVYRDRAGTKWVTAMRIRECAAWERWSWRYRVISDFRWDV